MTRLQMCLAAFYAVILVVAAVVTVSELFFASLFVGAGGVPFPGPIVVQCKRCGTTAVWENVQCPLCRFCPFDAYDEYRDQQYD